MALREMDLDRDTLSCSICLEQLKDPVTIPCGHSFCLICIQSCWDRQTDGRANSCPQCRQRFRDRPVLVKTSMLAAVLEQLKKTGLHAAAADVACDVCTGRKLKAVRSCLDCLTSYCEDHLQHHHRAAPLRKHQLVEPCHSLQENYCARHSEVMKMFCRTDQQNICYLCSVDQHKGHEVVAAAAERTEKQREIQKRREKIQLRIQDREKEVKLLQLQVKPINRSSDESVQNSEEMLDELIALLQMRRSKVKQLIRSQQGVELKAFQEQEVKVQLEIRELKTMDAELLQLSQTHLHTHFLNKFPSAPQLSVCPSSPSIPQCPLKYFESVTASLCELRETMQDVLTDAWTNLDDLLLASQPKTRAEFLQCTQDITLDPNTAHERLQLSAGNRKATFVKDVQAYPAHPERFTVFRQVLSSQSLTGRCYWEVQWTADCIYIAVAYKNTSRDRRFGASDESWALFCDEDGFSFLSNTTESPISAPPTSRIGVYLDHTAGILSFYSVSDTMTLIHTVQTTFTQPLYAGLDLSYHVINTAAKICKLSSN